MRLCLFGGTFDPVHNAHLALATEACEACQLDEVWFVPNAVPPHKVNGAVATWEQRFCMVELACTLDPRFHASRLEEAQRKSYTIHTLETVRQELEPEDELFFLIGADAFAEIESWYRKDDVLSLAHFIVLSRPGHQYHLPARARVTRLETLQLEIASSTIREQLREGRVDVPVPAPVLDYILAESIYRISATPKSLTAAG